MAIKRDLEQSARKCENGNSDILDTRVDLYLSTDGYEISKSEYVVKAMDDAHKTVFGKPVPYAKPIRYGITSDGSRYRRLWCASDYLWPGIRHPSGGSDGNQGAG